MSNRDLVLSIGFFGHLKKKQVGQFGDVLVIGDPVVFENAEEIPEFSNNIGSDATHEFSSPRRYATVAQSDS
jgi:hypothetical protein